MHNLTSQQKDELFQQILASVKLEKVPAQEFEQMLRKHVANHKINPASFKAMVVDLFVEIQLKQHQ